MKEPQMLQAKAYEHLIGLIKDGKLKEGEFYSLNKMAQDIGVSRTPFRDAVLRLEQERYIDVFPSKGFTLHKMTEADIIGTYQIRNALEIYCFKQLSRQLNTERGQTYYKKLTGKVDSQVEIMRTTHDNEDFARKDYEFHRSVVQFVGNEAMLEIYRRFMYRIFWQTVTSFSREGRMEETVKEHVRMLEMIKDGKLRDLETLIDHHMNVAQKINLDLI
ncbi:MAG: GntR family transcriptional regulator [Eubacterium sp.]|nr:GntR family transcriptional regulator [Eubacterium sp.]